MTVALQWGQRDCPAGAFWPVPFRCLLTFPFSDEIAWALGDPPLDGSGGGGASTDCGAGIGGGASMGGVGAVGGGAGVLWAGT